MLSVTARRYALVAAIAAAGACTVHDTQTPSLSGPSGLALSLRVAAVPSSLAYGVNSVSSGEQSAVTVTALGPDGRGVAQLPIRLNMEMTVGGVTSPQDFGTLRERNIVTGSDGTASTTYTAPPIPANGAFLNNCDGSALGTCLRVVATPTSNNFGTVNPESVQIRIVPTGVILPPATDPTAVFTFSPSPATANVPVVFDASASQPGGGASTITSYAWTFGDGTSDQGKTVRHNFATAGTFVVTLTVTSDRNISKTSTQNVTVGNATAPTPLFTISPTSPGVNQPVFFNGGASTPGAGHQSITAYRWTFGDGATASGQTVSHAYSIAGTYVAQLAVTDDSGATATSTGTTINVSAGGSTGGATTASFIFSPATPSAQQPVFFNASASTAATGHTLSQYLWDFGDGTVTPSTTASIAHTFAAAGTFSVKLTVTDDANQKASVVVPITVAAGGVAGPPTARFTSSPQAPGINQDVFFNASQSTAGSGRTITLYSWDFGDGSTATGITATHAYTRAGTFTVTLVVTDDANQTGIPASGTVTVSTVSGQIVADFTFSPTDPKIANGTNVNVNFDGTPSISTAGITRYDWQWGDGTSNPNGGQFIQHTFGLAGTYVVRLTVTDALNRTATTTKTVTVSP